MVGRLARRRGFRGLTPPDQLKLLAAAIAEGHNIFTFAAAGRNERPTRGHYH